MTADNAPTPSRADPKTLVPAARAMYERGFTRSQVLEAIYGVDLPCEAVLFLRDFVNDDKPLQASWFIHPWELMIPLESGGPSYEIGPLEYEREVRAYGMAPNLLLLGITGYNEAEHGASVIAYDLDELRAGRSTVVGLNHKDELPESGANFTVFGPSLVDVYADLITRYRDLIRKWIAMGVGGETAAEIKEMTSHLASVDAIRQELASSGR
jgi:hypothetical protein